jgi:acetyl esterase/lipase
MSRCRPGCAAMVLAMVPLCATGAERHVESNVVYGMYSGLALLMDIHQPAKPNGYAVIYISGSAWHAPLQYGAGELKSARPVELYVRPLVEAGYTVFSLNHRAAPRFHFPAPMEDAQRAVRFIRHHAVKYGIRPDRIGAAGGSSGGHLVSLLGVLDGAGDPQDPDPVNRESAKVQCVVARAPAIDLFGARGVRLSFMGVSSNPDTASAEYKLYRLASPVYSVTNASAPFLLLHGDADATVPIASSERMEQTLKAADVDVKLLRIPGGTHDGDFGNPPDAPDYLGEMVRWFDHYLVRR